MPIKWSTDEKINKIIEDAWLGEQQIDESSLVNPLVEIPEELQENPEMYISWLMTQPEYFSFVCSEILNIEILPQQALVLHEMWHRRFPMIVCSRGFGKTFLLAVYCILRLLLLPGRKVVVAGAAFRQSKFVFEYMETIYNNAPILRDIIGNDGGGRRDIDMCKFHIGSSTAFFIPIGDGSKVRGLRANDIFADEFASINRDIFETVLAGFAAVKPKPIDNVKMEASIKKAKEMGVYFEEESDKYVLTVPNQIVISGTADYDFKHFATYWKRWKAIVTCRGDMNKLGGHLTEEAERKDLNYKDYSIIRIPYELIPRGFMDEAIIARSKATMHSGTYGMEYGACFSKDSAGYYRRSLVETCVVSRQVDWSKFPEGAELFEAMLRGDPKKRYVYSIDPASEVDNFSITMLELYPTHRRIVYCWVTNAKEHAERVKRKLTEETHFYAYCCRKVRELMKFFPCERIAIDGQGGGKAVIEGFHDKDKLEPGEQPLYHVIDPDEPRDSDGYSGLHIIEEIKFANADWTTYANTGLRKDLEDKVILFPFFDSVTLSISSVDDMKHNRIYDTLEDCVLNIEELKNELASIVMTVTPGGRDRWDTPEYKMPGGKKGRMRKDRYSALLMANAVARQLQRTVIQPTYISDGGFAEVNTQHIGGPDFVGPAWFTNKMNGVY